MELDRMKNNINLKVSFQLLKHLENINFVSRSFIVAFKMEKGEYCCEIQKKNLYNNEQSFKML